MQLKQQEFVLSHFWRLEVQDQGVNKVGSFRHPSAWIVYVPLLPGSSHGLPSVCVFVLISSNKDISHAGSVPHFNLITSFKILSPNAVTFQSNNREAVLRLQHCLHLNNNYIRLFPSEILLIAKENRGSL
jgi:hypothetical protein